MRWDTTKKQLAKSTSQSIVKSKSGIDMLRLFLRLISRSTLSRIIKSDRKWRHFCKAAGICTKCLSAILILLVFSPIAYSAELSQSQAVKTIIGEAANQGMDGMTGVAEVLRRRGSNRGFYGAKREKFISSQPKWVHEMARKAWERSEKSNLTKGATHFENVKAFGVPYWASKMKKVAVINDHTFYREVRS